jgi:prevent-host-death family protein
MTKISSAEFRRNFDLYQDRALTAPVTITRTGHEPLVLMSAEEYARLKRRDRRVVLLEDFTDEEMALIAKAEVPPGHEHLDEELKDWKP